MVKKSFWLTKEQAQYIEASARTLNIKESEFLRRLLTKKAPKK